MRVKISQNGTHMEFLNYDSITWNTLSMDSMFENMCFQINMCCYHCVKYRNFLVQKFCRKGQFPQSFGQIARNSTETMHFRTRKFWCFTQCMLEATTHKTHPFIAFDFVSKIDIQINGVLKLKPQLNAITKVLIMKC